MIRGELYFAMGFQKGILLSASLPVDPGTDDLP